MASSTVSRRAFLGSVAGGVALSALSRPILSARHAASQVPAGPNDQIVLGMIGVGLQGMSRLREFLKHPDTRIAAISDVDRDHLDRAVAEVEKIRGQKPKAFVRFPPCARRSRDRRGRRRHARSLARDSDRAGVRGGEGRVRREALELQRGRRPHDGGCVAEVQARQPDGQSHPQRPSPTTGASSSIVQSGCARTHHACPLLEDVADPARTADDQSRHSAADARL